MAWRCVAAACVWSAGVAEAQLNVTITDGLTRRCRSPSCRSAGRARVLAAADFAGVIGADLGSSGRFAPLATRDMVSRPTQAAQINFQDWRVLDADYLVIGTLNEDSPDNFTATFQLFDVLRGESLTGFRIQSGRADLAQSGAPHLGHDFRGAHGHPGRVQHADRLHQRGAAPRQLASCSA